MSARDSQRSKFYNWRRTLPSVDIPFQDIEGIIDSIVLSYGITPPKIVHKNSNSIYKPTVGIIIDFRLESKMNYENMGIKSIDVPFVVKVKIKDKSSVKFVVGQNKQKILEGYSKIFERDILLIN